MRTKEVNISIDIDELERQLEKQREQEDPIQQGLNVRSTVFSLGKDRQVGTISPASTPDLRFVELLKDAVDNPFVELNWRVPRRDVDAGGVVGFNVYRRRLTREEIERDTRDDKKRLRNFSRSGFDRVSRKIVRHGKFSDDKKAISHIRRSLIPADILNSNISRETSLARARFDSSLDRSLSSGRLNPLIGESSPTDFKGRFENFFTSKKNEKIGYVDYSKFLAKEKGKFVFVVEREFVDLSFRDKKVGYGEVFEYYITSVTKESNKSTRSNIVKVKIDNPDPIRPPAELSVRQLNEVQAQVRICIDPRDNVGNVILFRKSESEILFRKVVTTENINDYVSIVDSTVRCGKSYTYRVFLESIHGVLSEPKEIEYTSTTQKITPQSRSNVLKIPIISAVQDQNSDFIKVTISPNDSLVSYYELDRRDLSLHERKFIVPSLDVNGYSESWETNKFFVQRKRSTIVNTTAQDRDVLNKETEEAEIVFADNTVDPGHIYQYRVRGYDLFGNPSSYAFVLVRVIGKKAIRSPIGIKLEVLRDSPLRLKLVWEDDNLATSFTAEELFEGKSDFDKDESKFLYKVQRRKFGENVYETFPLTANKFIVDEVASLDVVPFSSEKTEDTFVKVPNIEREDVNVKVSGDKIDRPFGIPNFLKENDTYFYRIAAMAPNEDESNFTEEFKISTLPDLSDPIDFKVEAVTVRVRPLVVRLSWGVENTKVAGDHYVIERKFDVISDSFEVVGRAYIENEFFDRSVEVGNTYIYRIRAIDSLGRGSPFVEERLTV